MTNSDIRQHRLCNQGIHTVRSETPRDVVARLGAVQAQDFPGALWSIGLRLPGCTIDEIERAIAEKAIVRSWSLRGTLHIVAAEDLEWILALTAPRIIARSARRYRELNLDEEIFAKSDNVLSRALRGGRQLMRAEVNDALREAGINPDGQRSYHILNRLGLERRICFGSMRGRQHTFVLFDEWQPRSRELTHDEALAELALRYFSSRGPATLQDFVWWSGLTVRDARTAIAAVEAELNEISINEKRYLGPPGTSPPLKNRPSIDLLPGFDEYLLGYKDRTAAIDTAHAKKVASSNGMFRPTILVEGRVVGLWKSTFQKDALHVTLKPFRQLSDHLFASANAVAARYAHFLKHECTVVQPDNNPTPSE